MTNSTTIKMFSSDLVFLIIFNPKKVQFDD
jgi:hypothetical protein